MCVICLMLDKFGVPAKPRDLVNSVNEVVDTDKHKAEVYDKAIDLRMTEDGADSLDFIADLASEIQRDLLRRT